MDINKVVEKFRVDQGIVALGPSSIEVLANEEHWSDFNQKLAVPDNLMRLFFLIQEGSTEHRNFLIRLIRYFRAWPRPYEDRDSHMIDRIIEVINKFKIDDRLIVIDEEMTDPEIKDSFDSLYPGRTFEIALSPKRNFLRDYLIKIYSWSKRTGGLVLERTRRVFSDIGHHIATFQLPDKLDKYVQIKSRYVGCMFNIKGGKAVKFFVGLALGIGGLNSTAASIAGIVITFTDP